MTKIGEPLLVLFSCIIIFSACFDQNSLDEFQKVFEPRFSLQHVQGKIPFWKPFGSTTIRESYVSLITQASSDVHGQLWGTKLLELNSFETEIKLRIGPKKAGEKLAVFFANKYSSSTRWSGLGIFLREDAHGQASMFAITNDGTTDIFPHQYPQKAIGLCSGFQYRLADSGHKASFYFNFKMSYRRQYFTLSYSLANQLRDEKAAEKEEKLYDGWKDCFSAQLNTAPSGFIGLSASREIPHTLTDLNDIYSVLTYSYPVEGRQTIETGEKPRTTIGLVDQEEKIRKKVIALFEKADADVTFDHHQLELVDLSHSDKSNPRIQTVQILQTIEKKQFDSSEELYKKFKKMHSMLNEIDKHNKDTILKLQTSVTKIRNSVDRGQSNLEGIIEDFNRLTKILRDINSKLPHNEIVKTSERSYRDAHLNIEEELGKSNTSNVWVIFGIFQVFFIMVFLYYYRSFRKKDVRRRF
jgi:hypothetical protein